MIDRHNGGRSPAWSIARVRAQHPVRPTDPLTPFRILVLVQVTAAFLAGLFGALPTSDTQLRVADSVIAVVLVAFSLVVWFVLPQVHDDLGLDIAIAIDICIAGFAAAYVPLQNGQFEVGIGLIVFGIFAAYFRPRRRFLAHLVFIGVAWTVGSALNPQLPTVVDGIVVLLAIVGISLMVFAMAERLRALALYDSLTGALNRRGLDLMAAPLAAAGARTGTPVALAMVDLDRFKDYNDQHGHLAGDQLLVTLTAAWRAELRTSDLLVRYGGDEFALVLPRTTEAEARELVARLRAAQVASWSVGIVGWHPGEDVYDALARADRALFEAKRARPGIPRQPDAALSADDGAQPT